MRFCRFGPPGVEKPAVIIGGDKRLDVSATVRDYDESFFASGGTDKLREWLAVHEKDCPAVPADARVGPCIARPSKIVCIGLNYASHTAEAGMTIPKEPVLFLKATTAISGSYDDIVIPRDANKCDWEVELAVVISKRASYVTEQDAWDYVAGYCLHNDYSEREFQIERSGQWVKGKSCDTFAPLGPFLATPEEISDPHNLPIWLKVNGEICQNSNTSYLIFKIPFLISYISRFMSLLPGDVISTGTPSGVGLGFKPPKFLKHGDVVEFSVEGLGVARQRAVAYEKAATPTTGAALG